MPELGELLQLAAATLPYWRMPAIFALFFIVVVPCVGVAVEFYGRPDQ